MTNPTFQPQGVLSLVVPLFNEEPRIPLLREGLLAFLAEPWQGPSAIEIILVDDGSYDATLAMIEPLKNEIEALYQDSSKAV